MAESKVERITDPSLLCDLSARMFQLRLDDSETCPRNPPAVELAILQPLANPDILAACRNRRPPQVHGDGNSPMNINSLDYQEQLNLRELGLAWRRALASIDPLQNVVFELALPEVTPDSGRSRGAAAEIYWMHKMPRGGCLYVEPHQVIRLITTLATALRMRSDGDVRFDVKYIKGEGDARLMQLLRRQLFALAECNSSIGDGEWGYQVL